MQVIKTYAFWEGSVTLEDMIFGDAGDATVVVTMKDECDGFVRTQLCISVTLPLLTRSCDTQAMNSIESSLFFSYSFLQKQSCAFNAVKT